MNPFEIFAEQIAELDADLFAMARKHPRWNPETLRVVLTREEIEKLPIRSAHGEEIHEAMQGVFFNPTTLYPKGVALPNEAGHDNHWRYLRWPR